MTCLILPNFLFQAKLKIKLKKGFLMKNINKEIFMLIVKGFVLTTLFFGLGFSQSSFVEDYKTAIELGNTNTANGIDTSYYYNLSNTLLGEGSSLGIINGKPVMIRTDYYQQNQLWRFTDIGNGYYRIHNMSLPDNKSLDIYSGNYELFLNDTGNSSGQFWKLIPTDNNYYRLSNQFLGDSKSFDTYSYYGPFMNNTENYPSQFWKFTKVEQVVAPENLQITKVKQVVAPEDLQINSEERILYIGSKQVDCQGVIPQKCFLVRESPDGEWVFFYDEIIGFNWEAGYEYELLVKATSVKNPPLDRSSMIYELIEIISDKNFNKAPLQKY